MLSRLASRQLPQDGSNASPLVPSQLYIHKHPPKGGQPPTDVGAFPVQSRLGGVVGVHDGGFHSWRPACLT